MGYSGPSSTSLTTDDQPEPSEQDQEIFLRRLANQTTTSIAKQLGLTVKEVDAALVRACRPLTPENQLVAWNLELARMERLAAVHFQKAMQNGDIPHSAIHAKYNERICAMRGWDVGAAYRRDPVTLQLEVTPPLTTTEQIDRALAEVRNNRQDGKEPPAPVNNRGSEKMLAALNNLAYDPLYGGKPKEAEEPKPDEQKQGEETGKPTKETEKAD